MDRSPGLTETGRPFTWRRVAGTLLVASAVILIGSWLVRAYPNHGYRAGYEATITKGREWVRAKVDASAGNAMTLCETLHNEAEHSPRHPRYDHDTYVAGCSAAVDHLYGRSVPLSGGADRNLQAR